VNFDEADFEMDGEPELLRSLIETLLENAIKFSPPQTTAGISLSVASETLILRVSDEGRGVPEAAIPYLFDRFFRSDKTRHQISGSGLGLSIVERVATLHGGHVSVHNAPSGGAVFTVRLPRPNV
jgi:signal transduction histidine kinase